MATTLSPMYQGNTRTINVTIKDSAGVGVDITNDDVILTIKDSKCADIDLFTLTNSVGDHTTPASGITSFEIDAVSSILFPIKNLALDVTWIDSASKVTTVVDAILPVSKPVRTPA